MKSSIAYYVNVFNSKSDFVTYENTQDTELFSLQFQKSITDAGTHFKLKLSAKKDLYGVSFGIISREVTINRDYFLLIPGAVYNGNRFSVKKTGYPPSFSDPGEYAIDKPTTITDIPHLSLSGDSYIGLRAGDGTTPLTAVWDQLADKAYVFLYEQKVDSIQSESGVYITESENLQISIQYPIIRNKGMYRFPQIDSSIECQDLPIHLDQDETIEFNIEYYEFRCKDINQFYAGIYDLRNQIHQSGRAADNISFSQCYDMIEKKYNERNWDEKFSYYKVGMFEHIFDKMQIGWVGGGISNYTLLKSRNPLSVKRSKETLDFIFNSLQTPSGLFYGIFDGETKYGDNYANHKDIGYHLVRKSADALYYFVLTFNYLRNVNEEILPLWEQGCAKLANAFVKIWQTYRQIGYIVDNETAEILVGGSSSGAITPAGLAHYSLYTNNNFYLVIAQEIGDYYYQMFIQNGLTNGGPGEILTSPDSESAYALFESMVTLYETTKDRKYLLYSENVFNYLSTWCMSYDYTYLQGTEFERLKISTTGSVFANCQNKHSAPGFCTFSGSALLRLYLYTKNEKYLLTLIDIAHGITQYVSYPGREVYDIEGNMLTYGQICERVSTSDWEGYDHIGEVSNYSCWCEVSAMLTYTDLPGVIILKENKKMYILDHVQGEITGNSVVITNNSDSTINTKVFVVDNQLNYVGSNLDHFYMDFKIKSKKSDTVWL